MKKHMTLILCLACSWAGAFHDPMKPYRPPEIVKAAVKPETVDYRLEMVYIGDDDAFCIMSGQKYHIHDSVGRFVVTNIDFLGVTLSDGQHNQVVKF